MDVPVLVVAFNRPQRLSGLVDRLREVKPSRVYVAVDGPRPDVAGEDARVLATRAEVARIDWSCDVRTLFRPHNLGCGRGVSGAIDWLFSQEERGIVLEDDVLPQKSLFPFCADLLERYSEDSRVWAVSGCNFVPPEHIGTGASYRFSTVPHIWGWATWRRSWSGYRYSLRGWRRRSVLADVWRASPTPAAFAYWSSIFEITARQLIDTWDYQAVLAAFCARGLTATSNVNLVTNVGFGAEATHTSGRPDYLRPAEEQRFPLRHPSDVERDELSEAWTRRHVLGAAPAPMAGQAARFLRRRLTS